MKRAAAVSIRMVAERAGVSPATVSNVLTGKSSVNHAIATRVRDAADAMGYVPDSHASRLRSGRHSLAGVVVPDLTNPTFGTFVSTLERLARADGFDLLVVSCDNAPAQEVARLSAIRSWRPAGLIVIPCDDQLADRLPKGGCGPMVVADRIPDAPDFDVVAVDNARAAGAIAAHLAAQGHASCLVAGRTLSISTLRERWEGTQAAAGPMALRLLEIGLDPAEGAERLRTAIRADRPPALFSLDEMTTLAAYQLLRRMNLAVPGDIAFASFDDAEWMCLVSPPVTAVGQPVGAVAAAAWRQLMARLNGDEGLPRTLRLTCTVELRGSSLRGGGGAA